MVIFDSITLERSACLSDCYAQTEKWAYFFGKIRNSNLYERGTKKQMRSSIMMNRIDIIIRPAISGFDFPCFIQAQNNMDNMDMADKFAQIKDQDKDRYRRK